LTALAGYAWDTAAAEHDRVLATVLFTDIVGSTERAAMLGDRAWRELIEQHHALVRARGREIDTAGDGFFASFDGPGQAIRCAWAIREAMSELGLEVRAGLHAGECELIDGKPAGIAVHTAARIKETAEPGEVRVSSTGRDLVAGSGLEFRDRGIRALEGIPGERQLYAAENR
jgi:class 3 adenylate cyclase